MLILEKSTHNSWIITSVFKNHFTKVQHSARKSWILRWWKLNSHELIVQLLRAEYWTFTHHRTHISCIFLTKEHFNRSSTTPKALIFNNFTKTPQNSHFSVPQPCMLKNNASICVNFCKTAFRFVVIFPPENNHIRINLQFILIKYEKKTFP